MVSQETVWATVMLPAVLILIWFFILLYFTFWNLQALSKVPPLSWQSVGLVSTYAVFFTLSVILLLAVLAVVLAVKNRCRSV